MTAETVPDTTDRARQRTRLRLVATSMALMALAITQSPGLLIADTKLDLVVNPGGALLRSLTMWDGQGAFGQVGNQSYGYLWPMGPFFWLGELVDVSGWLVQRFWMGLVLVVAFQGAARLARALGLRSDLAIIVTGLAYALSPRILTTVGPISIEAWPSALAPWVLLALVLGSRQGSARRYALGAALGVAMVGGVNAAATFAVIPLGAVWVLTRTRGPRRRALMLWWPLFTLLCCLWWLVPLVVLGTYSPPFLDYIETADVTTYPTTLFDSLRGTTAWIPYVEDRWRAGNDLITTPILILNSTVLVILGLAGIVRRDNPHRTFLALGLLVGLLMVTFGHSGAQQGWFGAGQRELLDGVLAPFRNVHKFDPVIRLPMVLGLGHLLDTTVRAWTVHRQRLAETAPERTRRERLLEGAGHLGIVWLALIALAGSTLPALTGRLAPAGEFYEIPGYWRQASSWLAAEDPHNRAMLLPASAFGSYVWGTPQDEPLQPLAEAPWAVRNAIPLAPTGNIRSLDALEERINRGEGSAALAPYFRRNGVRYLVVRNDLRRSNDIADPVLVHQALATSPGISLAKTFGPDVGGQPRIKARGREAIINQGWQAMYPAIEVFEVSGTATPAVSTHDLPVVLGGPEDLLTLTEQGLLGEQPTVLGYDADTTKRPDGPVVLTDGLRFRDRFFGRSHDGYSPTLTEAEAGRIDDLRDYEVTSDRGWQTTARLTGARDIVASSSLSDARTPGGARLGQQPYAAVDGDEATSWISRADSSEAARLRLVLDQPRSGGRVSLLVGDAPDTASELRIRTEAGVTGTLFVDAGDHLDVTLPEGKTDWIQVEEATGEAGRQISVAELTVPGVSVRRWLAPPPVPAAWGAPEVISLDARTDARTGCAQVGASLRCAPNQQREGEETTGLRRLVTLPESADYALRMRAVPRAGAAVPALLQENRLLNVRASSRSTNGASASSALATVDGDPGTTWISSSTDPSPSLDVRWLGKRRVTGLTLSLDPGAPARRPTRVIVSYPGGRQRVSLNARGHGVLRPVRTSNLSIVVDRSSDTTNVDFDENASTLGVGISEVSVAGMPYAPAPLDPEPVDFGCDSGPQLRVGPTGTSVRTAVVGAPLDIHFGRPVDLRVCGDPMVHLVAGENQIELDSTDEFSPASMVLTRSDVSLAPVDDVAEPAATDRDDVLDPADGDDVVVLRHNTNPGWTASRKGADLGPMTVDGWQQAFALDDGTGPVRTSYAPNTPYRAGLAVGGVTLFLSFVLFLWWRFRSPDSRADTLTGSRLATVVGAGGFTLAAGLVAGWAGVAVFVVAAAVLWAGRRRRDVMAWVAVAPVAVVGAWNAIEPWGSTGGWYGRHAIPQLLMVVPLALVAFVLVDESARFRKRASGFSRPR